MQIANNCLDIDGNIYKNIDVQRQMLYGMTPEEIDVKSRAMRAKLERFCMKDIRIIGFYDSDTTTIVLIDVVGRFWKVYGANAKSIPIDSKAWIYAVSNRSTVIDLHERYNITLIEEVDYAIVFDHFKHCAEKYGTLSIFACSASSICENVFLNFFEPYDTAETILVDFDLHANELMLRHRIT